MTHTSQPEIRHTVEAVLHPDESIETILHRACSGPLHDRTEVWSEYTDLDAIPNERLDGWEELLVFTDQYVRQWVVTGYDATPTTIPRGPEVITASGQTVEVTNQPSD